ncbi:MAG: DUF1573 domain-containing protein [Ardenticatenales bacterium]
MSNNVTVKIDSRVFYGLVAILAVAGIFAIGMYLGGMIGGKGTASPAAMVDSSAPPAPVGAGTDTLAIGTPVVSIDPSGGPAGTSVAAPAPGGGAASAPVSAEEAPLVDGEPRIWIDEPAKTNWIVDMGTIPGDKPTEKDFTIRNIGKALLVIEDASASCGCTAAHVGKKELAPDETSQIRVSYDPRVNGEQGKFVQKQVRVKSNDPKAPLIEFTIQADVAAQ